MIHLSYFYAIDFKRSKFHFFQKIFPWNPNSDMFKG